MRPVNANEMTLEQIVSAMSQLKATRLPGLGKILCLPADVKRLGEIPDGITVEQTAFLNEGNAVCFDIENYLLGFLNLNKRELLVLSNEYRHRMRETDFNRPLELKPREIPKTNI